VPALEKGLDVIETLADAAVPQSLAELAARLKRSSSELFRMLNCLERRGYITRVAVSGKYALTLKLYTLAHAHSVIEKLLQAARMPMQELTEELRESCHLSVIERGGLVVVAQQESPEHVRLSIEIGGIFDPARTASGRLLLAHMNDTDRAAAFAASATARGFSTKARAAFNDTLAEVRRRNISVAESETIEGVRDIAALVGDPETGTGAALAVTRLLRRGERRDESALIARLRAAADDITSTLLGLSVS
jgi:DNA-binding IclR family transcriptional regulator